MGGSLFITIKILANNLYTVTMSGIMNVLPISVWVFSASQPCSIHSAKQEKNYNNAFGLKIGLFPS